MTKSVARACARSVARVSVASASDAATAFVAPSVRSKTAFVKENSASDPRLETREHDSRRVRRRAASASAALVHVFTPTERL